MTIAYQITCPGCTQLLKVPAAAVGQPAHCPHCRTAFDLPAQSDGSPGEPRLRRSIPRTLAYPAYLLLMLGLAGVLVNGFLTAQFSMVPGADLAFARGRVQEVRSAQSMSERGKPTTTDWTHAPRAAVSGVAAAVATVEAADAVADERLAQSWAPGMIPLHSVSTVLSALVVLGSTFMIRGRWFVFAVLGCIAAILNVNHLCCIPGAIAGFWGILALARDEGRAYFRR